MKKNLFYPILTAVLTLSLCAGCSPKEIGYCEGKVRVSQSDKEYAAVCTWFDVVPGINYSVSAVSENAEGIDVAGTANAVFEPLQGEVG